MFGLKAQRWRGSWAALFVLLLLAAGGWMAGAERGQSLLQSGVGPHAQTSDGAEEAPQPSVAVAPPASAGSASVSAAGASAAAVSSPLGASMGRPADPNSTEVCGVGKVQMDALGPLVTPHADWAALSLDPAHAPAQDRLLAALRREPDAMAGLQADVLEVRRDMARKAQSMGLPFMECWQPRKGCTEDQQAQMQPLHDAAYRELRERAVRVALECGRWKSVPALGLLWGAG